MSQKQTDMANLIYIVKALKPYIEIAIDRKNINKKHQEFRSLDCARKKKKTNKYSSVLLRKVIEAQSREKNNRTNFTYQKGKNAP